MFHDSTGQLFASPNDPAIEMNTLLMTVVQQDDEHDPHQQLLTGQHGHHTMAEATDTGTDAGAGIGAGPRPTSVSVSASADGSHHTTRSERGPRVAPPAGGETWRVVKGRVRAATVALFGETPTSSNEAEIYTAPGTRRPSDNAGPLAEAQANREDTKVFQRRWNEEDNVPSKMQHVGLKNEAVVDIETWIQKLPPSLQFLTIRFDPSHITPIPEGITLLTKLERLEIIFKQTKHGNQRARADSATKQDWPHASDILDRSVKNLVPLASLTRLTIKNAPINTLPKRIALMVNLTQLELINGKLDQQPILEDLPDGLVALSLRGNPNVEKLVENLIRSHSNMVIELDQEIKEGVKGTPPLVEVILDCRSKTLSVRTESLDECVKYTRKYLQNEIIGTHIRQLSLRSNKMEIIPTPISELLLERKNITILDLTDNRLTNIDDTLDHLKHIKELLLNKNEGLKKSRNLKTFLFKLDYWEVDGLNRDDESVLATFFKGGRLDMDKQYTTFFGEVGDISSASNIRSLRLTDTALLSSSKPHSPLGQITFLSLRNCGLKDTDIPSLLKCSSLIYLDISENNLSEINALNIPSLVKLNASRNNISAIFESTTALTALMELDLSSNNITDISRGIFTNLLALKTVDLSSNRISYIACDALSALSHLCHLRLNGNQITNNEGDTWPLTRVTNLELNRNKITSVDFISNLTALKVLRLWGNNLRSLDGFENHKLLEVLDLNDNDISDIPENFSLLGSLTELNISQNSLTSADIIFSIPSLRTMDLSRNQLEEIPCVSNQVNRLAYLSIQGNMIDSLHPSFTNLQNLRVLILASNQFTSIPSEVSSLDRLHVLDIQGNSFNEIPSNIQDFSHIKTISITCTNSIQDILWKCFCKEEKKLDLCNRGLSTLIPFTKNLTRLVEIDLSKNHLVRFPSEFQYLTELTKINVESNRITSIPSFISKLARLRELNMNNNKLALVLDPTIDHRSNPRDWYDDHEVGLPPELCSLRTLTKFEIKGNVMYGQLSPNILEQIDGRSKLRDPIEKILRLLEMLRGEYARDPSLPIMYDYYAMKLIEKQAEDSESHRGNYEVPATYIDLGRKAKAKYFLSQPIVSKKVENIWSNSSTEPIHIHKVYVGPGTKLLNPSYVNLKKGSGRPSQEIAESSDDNSDKNPEKNDDQNDDENSHLSKYRRFDDYLFALVTFLWSLVPGARTPRGNFIVSFILYAIYLAFLCYYTATQNIAHNVSSVYFSNTLKDTFSHNAEAISGGFYNYVENAFIPAAYDGWFASGNLSQAGNQGDILSYYRLASPIRLRQHRSKVDDCGVHNSPFLDEQQANVSKKCVRSYHIGNEDRSEYGDTEIFKWKAEEETNDISIIGQLRVWYSGGGFVQDLPVDRESAIERIHELQKNGWVDMQSRAIILQALISGDNADLMGYVIQLIEYPASGSNIITTRVSVINRVIYGNISDSFFVVEIILLVYAVGFFIHELDQASEEEGVYVNSLWNLIDWVIIIMLLFTIGFHFYIDKIAMDYFRADLLSTVDSSTYHNIVRFDHIKQHFLSVLIFFSWIRTLYFLQVIEKFGVMLTVMYRVLGEMIVFVVFIGIFIAGFGSAIFVLIGRSVLEFSTGKDILFSFATFMFGELHLDPIYENSDSLGPFFYYMYLAMLNILLLNLLIAVLTKKYEEIFEDSKKEYDLVFCDLVLEMQQDALHSPVNLVLCLRPFYRFFEASMVRFYRKYLQLPMRWGTYERRECWTNLDYDESMGMSGFFKTKLIPWSDFFNRTDIFGIRHYTSWVDLLTSLVGIVFGLVLTLLAFILFVVWKVFASILLFIGAVIKFIFKDNDGDSTDSDKKQRHVTILGHMFEIYANMHRYGMTLSTLLFSPLWYLLFLAAYYIKINKRREQAQKKYKSSGSNRKNHILVQTELETKAQEYGNVKDLWLQHGVFYFEVENLSRSTVDIGFKCVGKTELKYNGGQPVLDLVDKTEPNLRHKHTEVFGVGLIRQEGRCIFFSSRNGEIIYHEEVNKDDLKTEILPFVHIRSYGGVVYLNLGDRPTKLDFQHTLPNISSNKMKPYGTERDLPNWPMVSFDGKYCGFHDAAKPSLAIGQAPIPIHIDSKHSSNSGPERKQGADLDTSCFSWVLSKYRDWVDVDSRSEYSFSVIVHKICPDADIVLGFTNELPDDPSENMGYIMDTRRLFCASIAQSGVVMSQKINNVFRVWRPVGNDSSILKNGLKTNIIIVVRIFSNFREVSFSIKDLDADENADYLYMVMETEKADWNLETIFPFVSAKGDGVICEVDFDAKSHRDKKCPEKEPDEEVDTKKYSRAVSGVQLRCFIDDRANYPALPAAKRPNPGCAK